MINFNQIKSRDFRQPLGQWFWGIFIAIILVGVLIAVFTTIRGGKQWAETTLGHMEGLPENWIEAIQVTLSGGETFYIDSASVPHIQAQTQAWVEHRRIEVQNQMLKTLDQETEEIFHKALQEVPRFVDWYYSLRGEYTRLFYAVFDNLPNYLSQQLNQLVFQPAGTAESIDRMADILDARLAEQLHHAALELQNLLTRLVRAHRLIPDEVNVRVSRQWTLEDQLAEHLETYISLAPHDIARQGMATSAGVAVSAMTLRKLGAMTVTKASTKLAGAKSLGALTSVTSKLGLKTIAKAGGTLGGTGAASGATLCAGTPGCALVGGAVAGLAAWILVDKAVLETQEMLNRTELEDDLRQTLTDLRDDLRTTLKTRYVSTVQTGFARLRHSAEDQAPAATTIPQKDFVPARATHQE